MRYWTISARIIALSILLATEGCSTETKTATVVPPPLPPSGVLFQSAPLKEQFYTAMTPPDAASLSLRELGHKLGFYQGNGVNTDSNGNLYPIRTDYFSAGGDLITASGNNVGIKCEWIADGKTLVTVVSDLPEPQFEVVVKVVRDSVTATTQP